MAIPEDPPGRMPESEIDENLKETFPASDPPSWTLGTNHKEKSPPEAAEEAESASVDRPRRE